MSSPRSRTKKVFPRSAAIDLRWQAARGWPNLVGLQHPEGEHPSLGPSTPRRRHRAIPQDLGPEVQLQQVDLQKVLRSTQPEGHKLPKAKVRPKQRSATKEASQLNTKICLHLSSSFST